MRTLSRLKAFCDYLNGCDTEPLTGAEKFTTSWARGLWWGLLLGGIILFCGQSSKFIYIDF